MFAWNIELFAALASSFAAVLVGSGGDILFMSSVTLLGSLFLHHNQGSFYLGTWVAAQGIVATLVGGVAYWRLVEIRSKDMGRSMAVVAAGSITGSVTAYFLPSAVLHVVLAVAIKAGVGQVFLGKVEELGACAGEAPQVGKVALFALFATAVLTGGLGIGGGFLFLVVLARVGLSFRQVKGYTLILTCTNLVTSFILHVSAASTSLNGVAAAVVGALAGSLLAAALIRRTNDQVAFWGLRTLLVGSAVMSWVSVGLFRFF